MEAASSERNTTFFRFEDLRIYHKALDYINWVHNATTDYPVNANDNLTLRFNETARSIAINIAEGSARNKSQFIYYLKMAKSSVREALVCTSISAGLSYLTPHQEVESRNYLMELTKMIGALISSLQRSTMVGRDNEDQDEEIPVDTEDLHDNF